MGSKVRCHDNLAIVLGVLGVVSGSRLRNWSSHRLVDGKYFYGVCQFLFFLRKFGTFFGKCRRPKIDSFTTLLVKVGEVF
jgi:hypothetical protein